MRLRILEYFDIMKMIWEKWDLRFFVLLSLFLQVGLSLFSPLRKRTITKWVTGPIWVAYLLSGWAANYAVGLIASSQRDSINNSDLLAFWAPFLMVHLGGPDTMTAYALEDNKLWLRHLFFLVFQSSSAILVFIQSLPRNQLLIPNVLMFIFGFYKYGERTVSLYKAHADTERVADYTKAKANTPASISSKDKLSDTEVVLYAYQYFESLKDFTADLVIGVRERNWFRRDFLQSTPKDAFRIIEVELNFIYEELFTKVGFVYGGTYGYCGRFISFALVVASLLLFHHDRKIGFKHPDIAITYTLLIGAVVLDVVAVVNIFTSDWFIAQTKKLPAGSSENKDSSKGFFAKVNLRLLQPAWAIIAKIQPALKMIPVFLKRRWSENVSTYCLIDCCVNRRHQVPEMEKFFEWLDLTDLMDSNENVKSNKCTEELKDQIFEELSMKSNKADKLDKTKEITAARGGWILRHRNHKDLLPYVDMDFDKSLLIWHIATEICCCGEEGTTKGENKFKAVSKILSGYMVYLLIKQPEMMSEVSSIGEIRFRKTMDKAFLFYNGKHVVNPGRCDVIIFVLKRFLIRLLWSPYNLLCLIVECFGRILMALIAKRIGCSSPFEKKKNDWDETRLKEKRELCQKIHNALVLVVDPNDVGDDESKTVLLNGCILAQKLEAMEAGYKWEIVSKVWVEMLCYAAMRCSPKTHAIQLSKRGELATLVWLLMIHFGFGYHFKDNEARAGVAEPPQVDS